MTKTKLLAVTLLAALLSACSGQSDKLEVPSAQNSADSTITNLSWWSRASMDALMRYGVWSGSRSGYIAMFARDGVPIHSYATGFKDIESEQPMTIDTHVHIASMTKPITAVAAMTLVEEGKLSLDDAVGDYLPEFASLRVATSNSPNTDGSYSSAPAQTKLLIRHLLMFSSGIGPGREDGSELVAHWNENGIYLQAQGSLSDRVSNLAQMPLLEEPGTQWRYGFSADVLASVIEKISGQPLAAFMQERIFQPLGMQHTHYPTPTSSQTELATVYTQDSNKNLIAAPIPPSRKSWTPGGGGLVSTAGDYMRFALMLWNGGEYQGTRILKQSTIDNMSQLHVADGVLAAEGIEGLGWGLGMAVVADEDATITPDRNGDFWWAGYYGTTFFVSPSTGLVGVVMTQNEPKEYSGDPIAVFVVQALAFAGL
jgi:CubicO group peptidase (beta-lactamase class C family)